MYLDKQCELEFKENKSSIIGYLLAASWIYYHREHMTPILSDELFDKLCKWVYKHYDSLEHKYKHLINKDDLLAGSLFSIGSYDYPRGLCIAAEMMSEGKVNFNIEKEDL